MRRQALHSYRIGFFGLASILFTTAAFAQVAFVQIPGDPLTVNVGADLSFQIFNAEVPGSGQIFPSSCESLADMGVFAEIDGVLYTPDFSGHDCGSATGSLGERTPWSPIDLSDLRGDGSPDDPYVVSAVVGAGATGVQMRMTVTYQNGQNFFRINHVITSFQVARSVTVWDGADIFLASSDAGVFHYEPTLGAPGGVDCVVPPTYTILMIPITTPDRITANQFANVWEQIGNRELDNIAQADVCQDNGAALQWNRNLEAAVGVPIKLAVSFGDVPSAAHFRLLTFRISEEDPVINGETVEFLVETFPDADLNDDVDLWVGDLPEGFTASIAPDLIDAPGFGESTLTVTVGDDVRPGLYTIPVHGESAGEPGVGLARVRVVCDPPFLLGTTDSQPYSQTVANGSTTTLKVAPARPGGYTYQWYEGPSSSIIFPMAGATSAEFTTPPITTERTFWVRVTNSCGAVDSRAATIAPSTFKGSNGGVGKRRGAHHGGD